jgi:hypothetical protein
LGCDSFGLGFGLIASADDEFLCSEALALWALIRKARALVRQA